MTDKILNEDIKNIINDFDMSVFKDKTVFITGATGLIGKLCTMTLLNSNANVKVIALVRNKQKADKIFRENENLKLVVQDINDKIKIKDKVDYIIHTASTTSSSDFIKYPVETILTAVEGTKNVLEFAKKQKKLSGMIYLSSLEVYGQKDNNTVNLEILSMEELYNRSKTETNLFERVKSDDTFDENKLGLLNNLDTRSSYSESKRMVETLCISYGNEYNIPVKIARLAQTFGAGVEENDNRVFAQFARSIIKKENIVLHTKGETARNYCYTTDAVRAIFTILTKGENNQAYNVANKNTFITIANMAKLLENNNSKVQFEIDDKNRGYNPTVRIFLDTKKLEKLGWNAKVNLEEMFERTIKSMRAQK